MLNTLLLDIDGVVIRARHKYFSEQYAEDFNIPLEEILPFFKNEYKLAATGATDIKTVLPPYLQKWGWPKTVDNFLSYWFDSEKDIDHDLLSFVEKIRTKGVKVYLASDNETHRAHFLWENLKLENKFDGAFFSCDLGVSKSNSAFFEKVLQRLNVPPAKVEYWDDDPKNIAVAETLGIKSHVYTDYESFRLG